MGNLSRGENAESNSKENLEIKDSVTQMKNAFDELHEESR